MKKIITFTLLLTFIIYLTGCSNSKNLEQISFGEFYSMIESKESFILELSQEGCSHCAVFNPRFEKVLEEYNIAAKYLDVSKISEEQYNKFIEEFNDNEDIGTPTVLFIEEGREKTTMNRLSGEPSEKEIIRKLKQNNYIE